MNAAKIEKSARLQRVYNLLSSGRPYTTLEIYQNCGVCAVSAAVSELRQNLRVRGFDKTITCYRKYGLWFYQMR